MVENIFKKSANKKTPATEFSVNKGFSFFS